MNWFLIVSVFALVIFTVWIFWRLPKIKPNIRNRQISPSGIPYYWTVVENSDGDIIRTLLGIQVNSCHDFSIRKETKLDKLFKNLKLCHEFQTKDKKFDDKIYIFSDSPELNKNLYINGKAREIIEDLLDTDAKEIWCHNNFLNITLRGATNTIPETELLEKRLLQLSTLANIFKSMDPKKLTIGKFFSRLSFISFVNITAISLGIISAIMILVDNKLVHFYSLTNMLFSAFLYCFPVYFTWLLIIILLVRKSSRGHTAIIVSFFALFPGIIISYTSFLYYENIVLDTSPPVKYQVEVIKKLEEGRNRYKKVITTHWEEPQIQYDLINGNQLYDQVKIGTKIVISVKQGYLGYKWVESEKIAKN